MEKRYDTLLNTDFRNELIELGYKDIGSAWFENKDNTIRIRLWKDREVTFWL